MTLMPPPPPPLTPTAGLPHLHRHREQHRHARNPHWSVCVICKHAGSRSCWRHGNIACLGHSRLPGDLQPHSPFWLSCVSDLHVWYLFLRKVPDCRVMVLLVHLSQIAHMYIPSLLLGGENTAAHGNEQAPSLWCCCWPHYLAM